jgi:hypothetical protein
LELLSAAAVRGRAHDLLALGLAGALPHFRIELTRLGPTADLVADVTRDRYPTLAVPLHARWRHFVLNGCDLWAEIIKKAAWPDQAAKARAAFDLAVVSVLLDAGAGPQWRYPDVATGLVVSHSEGLALASLRMFEAGLFSSDSRDRFRVDAQRLVALSTKELAQGFAAGENNPLEGLEGRAALLSRLGKILLANPTVFGYGGQIRPGGLFDYLLRAGPGNTVSAPAILHALLLYLAPIWPNRLTLAGLQLGDTWHHPSLSRSDVTDGLVPLHKLSQWLTYSLVEPLRTAGIQVDELDKLTGLAEYRNGGLFVDMGVLALRKPAEAESSHSTDSNLVVEWRALTVALLDHLAPLVRQRLGLSESAFPLAALLEGGAWAAGRKVASQNRSDARPPITVLSDGTVF